MSWLAWPRWASSSCHWRRLSPRACLSSRASGPSALPLPNFASARLASRCLYTCAVGARLSSGQFLAASLISWFFRYWEYRYRQDVEVKSRGLIDETAALPKQARVLTVDGLMRLVPRAEVPAGQQVRVLAGEHVPVDGRGAHRRGTGG
jgi:hypothetical protein